jgi:phage terminase large subunit
MTEYCIVETTDRSRPAISLRGGARKLWGCKDHEVILSGPADTGKTFAALHRLDTLMWKYPRAQAAIVRKTQKSLYGSVCQTYQNKVANMIAVNAFGGDKSPDRYVYPNGSVIWLGGMDNADKVLSSERDFIYTNQTEELTEGDWETLATRVSGRAGNTPYAQMFGDCNPGGSLHWIRNRAKRGQLTLIASKHTDNPELYDDNGVLTDGGKQRLSVLENLTGVRPKRLLEGIWATAEGAIYDMFDTSIHVLERPDTEMVSWGLGMDEGYTNPAVILLIGTDTDGRLHIAKEYYETGKLQEDVVVQAERWSHTYDCERSAVDSAAAGLIADLRNHGINASPHKGRVLDGIQRVQNLLAVAGDGRPRLTVDPACVNTINEFESYVWKEGKDEPVKESDHALDALRYYVVSNRAATMIADPLADW